MLSTFKELYANPYHADMDALDWFLFIGLLLVLLASWRIIFDTIREIA